MHWENDDAAYSKNFGERVMPIADGITKGMNQDHHMSSEVESSKSF